MSVQAHTIVTLSLDKFILTMLDCDTITFSSYWKSAQQSSMVCIVLTERTVAESHTTMHSTIGTCKKSGEISPAPFSLLFPV